MDFPISVGADEVDDFPEVSIHLSADSENENKHWFKTLFKENKAMLMENNVDI